MKERGKEFEEFFLNLDLNMLDQSYIVFMEQNEVGLRQAVA